MEKKSQTSSGTECGHSGSNAVDECAGHDEPGGHSSLCPHSLTPELHTSSSDGRHCSHITYADAVLAEAESLYHAGTQTTTAAKVKAMDGPSGDSAPKGDGKGKAAEKRGGKGERSPCEFFGTDGCKKGAECTYLHDWTTIDKRGRCWNCSSTKNSKRECTVKAMSTGGGAPDAGGKGKKGGGKGKEVEGIASTLGMKKADKPDYTSQQRAVRRWAM